MANKFVLACAGLAAVALSAAAVATAQTGRSYNNDDRYFSVCDNGPRATRIACANRELADADRRLNVVYSRMITDAQRADAQERRYRYGGWYSREVALRNAERAWIAMRDGDCRFVTQPDIGRRRALDLSLTLCRADRTNARIDQLETMRDDLRESYS